MYYIYILLCSDKTLYTGIAKNIEKRLRDHREGKGSKYVRSRLPAKLIYSEKHTSKSEALKRESQIKGWNRIDKIKNLNLKT